MLNVNLEFPIRIRIVPRVLQFKRPAGTSRGVYLERRVWYVIITSPRNSSLYGLGECAPLYDLSSEYDDNYEMLLCQIAKDIEKSGKIDYERLRNLPSILMGFETAFISAKASLEGRSHLQLFDTSFSCGETGLPINGLVWMGSYEEMFRQMTQKLREGYHCIKLKIGAIEFQKELNLIKLLRNDFSVNDVELRVDANGGFSSEEALERINELSEFNIHSIEQPIKAGQFDKLEWLCSKTSIPIALDEELIGINGCEEKKKLLDKIKPQYLVLKPSLHGGFFGTAEWMRLAAERGIPYWVTSALESNVGLNAIAQWTSKNAHEIWDKYAPESLPMKSNMLPNINGFGTGKLFVSNYRGTNFCIKSGVLWNCTMKQQSFIQELENFKKEWTNESPFLTVQTSGSTGIPKQIQVEKKYMVASARKTCDFLGLKAHDSVLLCLPLKYIAGKMVVVRSIVTDLKLILVYPNANPMSFIDFSPTFVAMTPYQVFKTLENESESQKLRGVRHLIIGGGAVSKELEEKLKSFPYEVWSTYGMTETLSHVAMRRINGGGSSSYYTALPGVTLSTDADSCLIIDSPDIGVRHLHTNDVVDLKKCSGEFRILGRRDNVVCSGGVKLQIEQLESRLRSIPCSFCLTSIPDAALGEALVMVYKSKRVTPAQLLSCCKSCLSRYEIPKYFVSVEEIPMTETHKPKRADLKQMVLLEIKKKNIIH